jgi:hypothetical protein
VTRSRLSCDSKFGARILLSIAPRVEKLTRVDGKSPVTIFWTELLSDLWSTGGAKGACVPFRDGDDLVSVATAKGRSSYAASTLE